MPASNWRPSAELQTLQFRSQILWNIREFFHDHDMLEVHTPVLSRDTVIDRHLDPIVVPGSSLQLADYADHQFYLQTSPEFAMKRLVAAGLSKIYQVAQVFRAGERGPFHNPEFTMIEWYRSGDDLAAAVQLLSDLIQKCLECESAQVETYQDVFRRWVACDPLACSSEELAAKSIEFQLGVDLKWTNDKDTWLDLLFSEVVQPQLGLQRPTIVTHFPATQAALAQVCKQDSRVAERFELFSGGVELANGYHELLSAEEFAARNETVAVQRQADGKPPLPKQSHLHHAMQNGMPACSGCALGLDRLIMVASRVSSIDQVLTFPIDIA